MNEEINLLTTKKIRYSASFIKKIELVRLIAIVMLFAVSVLSFMLFILIAFSPLPALQAKEKELIASFSGTDRGEKMSTYYSTQSRLSDVSTILKKRTDVVKLYNFIQENTAQDVLIDILKIEGGAISLTISATSLERIEESIERLQEANTTSKTFDSLTMSRIAYSPGTANYLVYFQITLL